MKNKRKNNISTKDLTELKRHCEQILNLSESIRYVGIANRFGRTLAGKLRQDVKPLLKPEDARNEFFMQSMMLLSRENYEKDMGKTEYILTENKKVKTITLSYNNLIYRVTVEKKLSLNDIDSLIKKLQKLVKK
ncbi:MAG: hypothetical protein ACPKPY_01690 [Nitrososphaeraceae archaeon]